jgi:hypothetical protein
MRKMRCEILTMDLRKEILRENSREHTLKIADWVSVDARRVTQLVQVFLHDEYRVVQRAAWIISYVAHKSPALIVPHLPAMVQRMDDAGIPIAVKRNVTRVLQFLPIPPALHGQVMHHCFALLENPKETTAVRAFSMTVLANLAQEYPDIRNEIRMIVEDQLTQKNGPGFVARAKKVLKML